MYRLIPVICLLATGCSTMPPPSASLPTPPEILMRLEDGLLTVRPIAGTRQRGVTEEQDQALEEVSTLKRKMNSVWSRAAGMVRKQEGKSFSLETTTQLTVDKQVEVTLWVKRVA